MDLYSGQGAIRLCSAGRLVLESMYIMIPAVGLPAHDECVIAPEMLVHRAYYIYIYGAGVGVGDTTVKEIRDLRETAGLY